MELGLAAEDKLSTSVEGQQAKLVPQPTLLRFYALHHFILQKRRARENRIDQGHSCTHELFDSFPIGLKNGKLSRVGGVWTDSRYPECRGIFRVFASDKQQILVSRLMLMDDRVVSITGSEDVRMCSQLKEHLDLRVSS